MASCKSCGKLLTNDAIGVYKKMVNRFATEFLCVACLAQKFECETTLIENKIQQFKELGCALFFIGKIRFCALRKMKRNRAEGNAI